MFRLSSVALSQLRQGRSVTRTLGAIAALTLVIGCGQDVTDPTSARPTAAAAKPLRVLRVGAQVWNGRTVNFRSVQRNSLGQMVCLDIPWGQAFTNQDVNYFPCHSGAAQQFVITAWAHANPDSGSWAMIRPVSNASMCLDMRGGTTNSGERLQLFPCKVPNSAGSANQTFRLPPARNEGSTLLLTTICPKAQPALPAGKLALELPTPLTTSSWVQQGALVNRWATTPQLWMVWDVQDSAYYQSANGAGGTWGIC